MKKPNQQQQQQKYTQICGSWFVTSAVECCVNIYNDETHKVRINSVESDENVVGQNFIQIE